MFFVCHPVRFGQGEHYFIVKMGCCWQRFGSSTDRFQASSGRHNHKKQQIAKSERESQLFTKNTGAQGSFPPAHPPTPLALACPRPP